MADRPHTGFAHGVLRDISLSDPLFLLWAAHREGASTHFQNIWRRFEADEAPSRSAVDPITDDALRELHVEVVGTGPVYTALMTLPRPDAPGECFYCATLVVVPDALVESAQAEAHDVPAKDALDRALSVVVGSTTPEGRGQWAVPVRFFTLEQGAPDPDDAQGSATCVLGEWEVAPADGDVPAYPRHIVHGAGPAPLRDSFLGVVQAIVMASPPGDAE